MRTVRTFIMIGSLLLLVAALVAPADAQAPAARMQWKMQSSWPAGDFHQVNPKGLVEKIGEMTGGRLQVDLQPAGAVVQAFEVLDAVNRGLLEGLGQGSQAQGQGEPLLRQGPRVPEGLGPAR
ncbi:MAG: hypothetical protein ACREN5_09385, partial [Gemmatimonadales bacterium]